MKATQVADVPGDVVNTEVCYVGAEGQVQTLQMWTVTYYLHDTLVVDTHNL